MNDVAKELPPAIFTVLISALSPKSMAKSSLNAGEYNINVTAQEAEA